MSWAIRVRTGGTEAVPVWTDYSTTLTIRTISMSLATPRKVTFAQDRSRHDVDAIFTNDQRVQVSNDAFVTRWFDGWLRINAPRGVQKEGIDYTAYGPEMRLQELIAKNNDGAHYLYNRENNEDPQAPSGRTWTLGEILIDRLEHMCGIPAAGSAIPAHHDTADEVTHTYVDPWVVATWDATAILAFDLEMPGWEMAGEMDFEFLTRLVDFYGKLGWYIDPTDKEFIVADLEAGSAVTLTCGQVGEWVDKTGASYHVVDNNIEFSLVRVFNTVRVEGKGMLAEVRPSDIGGGGGTKLRSGGEMKEDWTDDPGWENRRWIVLEHDDLPIAMAGAETVAGGTGGRNPAIYVGTDDGAKAVVASAIPGSLSWTLNLYSGEVTFSTPPGIVGAEKLWLHHDAVVPFYVEVQGGTSWDNYGVRLEHIVYDESFVHRSLGVSEGEGHNNYGNYYYEYDARDDTALMTAIAEAIVRNKGDEKIAVTVERNGITAAFGLGDLMSFANLAKWDSIDVSLIEITIDPGHGTMSITGSNDIFGNIGLGELKRRADIAFQMTRIDRRVSAVDARVKNVEDFVI